MNENNIDWELIQLYMRIVRLKGSFIKTKKEYEEILSNCDKNIRECDEMLHEMDKFSVVKNGRLIK